MSLHRNDLVRWNWIILSLGGGIWGGSVCARLLGWIQLNDLEIVLLLALLVITPLALPFVLEMGCTGRVSPTVGDLPSFPFPRSSSERC